MNIAVSIVSHGHGHEVVSLLQRLCATSPGRIVRVWLTLNRPDAELDEALRRATEPWPFDLRVRRNTEAMGFGANHNQAFRAEQDFAGQAATHFAVLNPDIAWDTDPWETLLAVAGCGACVAYPRQVDASGRVQDHERELPTPWALVRRHVLGNRGGRPHGRVDWVNAAFLLFPAEVFRRANGFDARYHMYCEDVDLCLRLRLAGVRLCRADNTTVVHGAQRRSRRDPSHFAWHVTSLARLWCSRPFWSYLRQR